ncbi:MAG: putative DNA binding domain-containing protein [Bacteroidaceae bacterium]|nr:putative DNA binding domain-containing protein [Bacteroidaceae bacterium]
MSESQNIEFKSSWRDDYLKWICGFANAQGGKIYVGIDDNQDVVGVADAKQLMEDIPNKIATNLGIIADVNLLEQNGKQYIEIVVDPSSMPISYHGNYHYRSGATKQELKGVALQQFILKKMGRSWDDIPHERATFDCIDSNAITYFLKSSAKQSRLESLPENADTLTVLKNLRLVTDDGKLKYAALLLFAKDPQMYFPSVQFKLGRFGSSESDLMFDDIVEGNILEMTEKVMRLLASKYLISPIHYEGIQRVERLEIPEDALREVLCNAIVHKDYQRNTIQMKVYNDRIVLWNPGVLPDDLPIEKLFSEHHSHARNRNIAYAFYRAGFIEAWGRGIEKICTELSSASLQPPKFEQTEGGLSVTIMRNTTLQAPHDSTLVTDTLPHKYHTSTIQVKQLWHKMKDERLYTRSELMSLVGIKNRSYFAKSFIQPAIKNELIELLYPNNPHHPHQRYRKKN